MRGLRVKRTIKYDRACARIFFKLIMLDKYIKQIGIFMLGLVVLGMIEANLVDELKSYPDLPIKYFEVNYQIQSFSVFASTATLTSNLIKM